MKYCGAVLLPYWKPSLLGVIGNLINETSCKTVIVNGTEDHVHCFLGLKPVIPIAEIVKTVKVKSSKFINDHRLTPQKFEWQDGYGVFSYDHSQIGQVYRYIANQEIHRKKVAFREEYLDFWKNFRL